MSEQYDHMMSNTDGGCNIKAGGMNTAAHVGYFKPVTGANKLQISLFSTEINTLINNKHNVASCVCALGTMQGLVSSSASSQARPGFVPPCEQQSFPTKVKVLLA